MAFPRDRLGRRCQTRPGVSRPSGLIGFIEILRPAFWRNIGDFGQQIRAAEFRYEIPFDGRPTAAIAEHGYGLWKPAPATNRFIQLSEYLAPEFFRQTQFVEHLGIEHE